MALFNDGFSCGSYFQIKCDATEDPKWCNLDSPSIYATATNFYSPNHALPSDDGRVRGWWRVARAIRFVKDWGRKIATGNMKKRSSKKARTKSMKNKYSVPVLEQTKSIEFHCEVSN
ncbi:Expansin [Forsythia ovata]|uniref:Expansin n=1 Tax=Forsythia ovata TaxID=205694 RepID=A0ABD1UCP3_9LAMI